MLCDFAFRLCDLDLFWFIDNNFFSVNLEHLPIFKEPAVFLCLAYLIARILCEPRVLKLEVVRSFVFDIDPDLKFALVRGIVQIASRLKYDNQGQEFTFLGEASCYVVFFDFIFQLQIN